MLTAIGYIALAISVIGNVYLLYLKNKYSGQSQILSWKNEIYELKDKDVKLKEKQVQAIALNKPADDIFDERLRLSKRIAELNNRIGAKSISN